MLQHLPSLERVDLSSNLLVSLDLTSFVPLTYLKSVNLEHNFLKCNKPTQYLMDWLRKHEIAYEGPFCAVQRQDMFQRLEMHTSLDKITDKDIEENDLLRNNSLATLNATRVEQELIMTLFNKTYFKRCLLMDHEFVCHLLENCKNSLSCDKYLEEQQRHTRVNYYFVLAIFVIGVFLGCVLALCCCQAVIYCRVDKQRAQHRRRQQQQQSRLYEDTAGVQMRDVGRMRTAVDRDTQSTAVVESNGFHDFVNELFSRRRSRRQMISAIGQQGTNLVRQLSRSSMNLLRRSQYRAANASARSQQPTSVTPDTPPTPHVYEPVGYGMPRERSRSFTYTPEMVNSNNDYLIQDLMRQQQRQSVDSPPPYDMCVGLPKDGSVSD